MLSCVVQQIAEAQLQGTPADAFLSLGPKADAEADAEADQVCLSVVSYRQRPASNKGCRRHALVHAMARCEM